MGAFVQAAAPRGGEEAEPSPYPGLSYFSEASAGLFFGRDVERTLIIGNLRAARLTILHAPSGVGKSSLLRAGVAARLRELAARRMEERGAPGFIPVVFSSWRDDPLPELIEAIDRAAAPDAPSRQELADSRSLTAALAHAAAAANSTLLIILDGFEEYLLYARDRPRADDFTAQLADVVNRPDLPANVLIAVREDALAGVGNLLRGRIPHPFANSINLEYLGAEAARQAIVNPLERWSAHHPDEPDIEIEPELIEAVLEQVQAGRVGFRHGGSGTVAGGEEGGSRRIRIEAPYLQLVLSAVWNHERAAGSHRLRRSTLDELGGADSIVRSHLEQAMRGLPPGVQTAAVEVFNQLVTPSGSKIVHTLGDLAQYSGAAPEDVRELVERLSGGEQRILRPVPPAPGDDQPRVEIFHDVLAPAILDWRAAQVARRLERRRQAAEALADRERGRARRFRALAAVSLALLLVAVAAGVAARVETGRAHHAEHLALSRQLASEAIADLRGGALARGVLLSIEAYRFAPTADARQALVRAAGATAPMRTLLSGHSADVTSVAYSPDGRTLASGGADGMILLQTVDGGANRASLRAGATVTSLAFDPGLAMLASAQLDRTVTLWRLPGGRRRARLTTPSAPYGIAFSRDGGKLAVGCAGGQVILADPRTARVQRTLPGRSAVAAVTFSADGRTLAVGRADHTVALLDPDSGAVQRILRGPRGAIDDVAFDPAGQHVAAGSVDHTAVIWSRASGRILRRLPTGGTVNAVAFSPDGRTLAGAGSGRAVILWDAHSGERQTILRGHSAAVESVAFGPSGASLASGGDDGSVVVWRARPRRLVRTLHLPTPVLGVSFDAARRLLGAAGSDGAVTLLDPQHGQALSRLRLPAGAAESVDFSPDGARVAAGGTAGAALVWGVPATKQLTLRGHSDTIYRVRFSPEGQVLATASADGTVVLWSARTGARLHTLRGHTDFVYDVAFSPDSRLVASASADKSVMLFDASTGRRLHTLTGSTAAVEAVAFSPDGRTLASAGDDGAIRRWDPQRGIPRGAPIGTGAGSLLSVAFDPHGGTLLAGGYDGSVTAWDLRTGLGEPLPGHAASVPGLAVDPRLAAAASASSDRTVQLIGQLPKAVTAAGLSAELCAVVRHSLPPREWQEFVPGQPYHHTCPSPAGGEVH